MCSDFVLDVLLISVALTMLIGQTVASTVSTGNNGPYVSEVTDRIRANNPSSPGIRMQFKSPTNRNLTSTNLERNVSDTSANFSYPCFR